MVVVDEVIGGVDYCDWLLQVVENWCQVVY